MTQVRPLAGARKAAGSFRVAAQSGLTVFVVLAAVSTSGSQGSGPTPQLQGASSESRALSGSGTPPFFLAGRGIAAPPAASASAAPDDSLPVDSGPPKATPSEARFDIVEDRSAQALLTGSMVESAQVERPRPGTLVAPLRDLSPSSSFGLRTNPLDGSPGEFHWGLDFAADCGTPVFSADAGVVVAVGWHARGGGNRVELDHGNGLVTTYSHLESIALTKGDAVNVSTEIARVGTTGSSTGCHLHFETILDGTYADPDSWRLIPIGQQSYRPGPVRADYAPGFTLRPEFVPVWAIPVFSRALEQGAETSTPPAAAQGSASPAAESVARPPAPRVDWTPDESLSPPPSPLRPFLPFLPLPPDNQGPDSAAPPRLSDATPKPEQSPDPSPRPEPEQSPSPSPRP
ncbi:M23 family metallopeptidase, partial [Arthrobacter sp. Br18]|uniref:M23 family metallopeptidase n=1 Tax=Arthrobacter sp. Br18 TaxID=1312954 RepID=UPI00156502F5